MVQPVVRASRVISTLSPDVAVALGEYEEPPTTAVDGGVVLGVMVSGIDLGRTKPTLETDVPPAASERVPERGCGEA
jgi:hypothetical protein